MTRRQRIADLTTFALPSQPALVPRRPRGGLRADHRRRRRRQERDVAVAGRRRGRARTGRGRPARRLTRGKADSAPAWSPDGTRIAFLRARRRAGGAAVAAARRRRRTRAGDLAAARRRGARLVARRDQDRVRARPVDAERRARRGRRGAGPAGRRAARRRPARLQGRRGRAAAHRPQAPARARPRQRPGQAGHRGRLARRRPGLVARLGPARVRRRRPRRTRTCATAPPSTRWTCPAAFAQPRARRARRGARRARAWTPDGSALIVAGSASACRSGTCACCGSPSTPPGSVTDLAGSLDRNVMPGGPGYPGGRPQLADGGRTVRVLRPGPRAARTLTRFPPTGAPRRGPVVAGAGRVVSGLSVAGPGRAAVALATPDSYGEIVVVDLASGAETVLTGHGAAPGTASRSTPARSASSRSPTAPSCRAGWSATRAPAGPGPVLLDVHGGPHNAWNGAADPAHLYHQVLAERGWTVLIVNPRASDGYGEDVLHRGRRRLGRRRRPGLPRAARRAGRRGHRRPGPARRHRLLLRRLHDLLPDQPGRPVRRRRGRRRASAT